jgi:hypothetical protein
MHSSALVASPEQDWLEASPVVRLEAPERELDDDDWDEEDDELPGTDDEELDFDEYDEELEEEA